MNSYDFKETLFDLINECDALEAELLDIQNGDAEDSLLITMKDGKKLLIRVEETQP